MTNTAEQIRVALRRETHDFNATLIDLMMRLQDVDEDAAKSVRKARASLFEAWTILCTPPGDDDDHDH